MSIEAVFCGLGDVRAGVEARSNFAETLPEHGVRVAVTDLGLGRIARCGSVGDDRFVFHEMILWHGEWHGVSLPRDVSENVIRS